ncbi:RDD family protein [Streptomyces sp. NPDC020192]|uniref:RDD family protein n=1 Tax=Streptomyces sp. NPDC020192 TaxID=3365066 RepID=UPI0037B65867
MSAPTPAPGDDRPREGYYPDPSIPGYVRYWNGASWVPGTSRPAPKDGEPLTPPPGIRPAPVPLAVEETGPHFFDEDLPPSGQAGAGDGHTPWGTDPRIPAPGRPETPPAEGDAPDNGGTFIFRRPVPGPAAVTDDGTMTFRPVPGQPRPGTHPPASDAQASGQGAVGSAGASGGFGPQGSGAEAGASSGFGSQASGSQASGQGAVAGQPGTGFGPGAGGPGGAGSAGAANASGAPGGFGPQGPVGAPAPQVGAAPSAPAAGPGFGAGKAAAERAAAGQAPHSAQSAVAPSIPAQAAAPATPLTSGPGGGQASWAQQVHQLAGGGDEQPVAPWKPPVEDVFQAAARRQAAARPAGLGKRFAARLIDTLIVGLVTAAAAVPLGLRVADHVQQKIDAAKVSGREVTVWLLDGTTATSLGIVVAVLLLVGVGYEVLPTAKWGRTLGKRLLGLEVRDIEAHEPPAFGAALRRWLVYSVPGLLGIGIVGVLWCLFDRPWHQCWHDKAAHTFVAG